VPRGRGYDHYAQLVPRNDVCLEWFDVIRDEIDAGRPMLYSIPSGTDYGHAIVCDGYSDWFGALYHMNFGWGDSYTGWYVLDDLPPPGHNVDNEYLICGIEPRPVGWKDTYSLASALNGTLRVSASDPDGVVSVDVYASNNSGTTWSVYPMQQVGSSKMWTLSNRRFSVMQEQKEIWYYLEVTDAMANVTLRPRSCSPPVNGPFYEFSILPLRCHPGDPGRLIVDRDRRFSPGDERDWQHLSGYYYETSTQIPGYEFEIFEVDVPGGPPPFCDGPDSVGLKNYDTVICFTSNRVTSTVPPDDQLSLIEWLNMSAAGKERNLLLLGNNIGYDLVETGNETLGFYDIWLGCQYMEDSVGPVYLDSIPGLAEAPGGYTFMDLYDGECTLRGGVPDLSRFDVVEPRAGVPGVETVAEYIRHDTSRAPAGVAYTHPTLGYQTVTLGFGLEFMMADGYFHNGIEDRINLVENLMDYFGELPDEGYATGVVDGAHRNELSAAYPNPFNPVTRIAYEVKVAGRITINVYDVAGRRVRTLLDERLEAGASGTVVWDGVSDAGSACATGVYFYRIDAPGWHDEKKLILLK